LYEGKFIIALATTSAIWRSTGGDQTRTAVAGSMDMVAPFYIANTSSTTANVVVSSASGAPALILPAGAVVLTVNITNPSTGANSTCNVGYTPLIGVGPGQTTTLGTNVPNAFVNNANVTTRQAIQIGGTGGGTQLGNAANTTNLVIVTAAIGTAGAVGGPVTGSIRYYVADSTYGEEIV
jgi:hypothetical protein